VNRSPARSRERGNQLRSPVGVTLTMTTTIPNTRRALAATLVLTAALTAPPAPIAPTADAYTHTPRRICPIEWERGRWHVKRLIRCAARYWGVSPPRALAVANRESNFRPRAFNAWSCAKGIYQHLCRYWSGRAYAYGFKGKSAFNARANIIVTMKMVQRYGWDPWGL
jgi:hypothetical protein